MNSRSDQCTDIAAALTYFAALSIFPGLIATFSLLGVLGRGQAASGAVLDIVEQVAPGDTADTIREPIEQIAGSPAAAFALVVGILLALGAGDVAQTIWSIAKWSVLAFIVAILYHATPNAKQPRFRWLSIGALLAIIGLALATLAFGFYVANFANYERTYGPSAGIIIFLLWLWMANL